MQEHNQITRKRRERRELFREAKEKNVEYFEEKIAATEELEKRVWLVVTALESKPEVIKWAQKILAETLLPNQSQGLRICFAGNHYWVDPSVLDIMIKMPEIAEHLVECMSSTYRMRHLKYYNNSLKDRTGRGFTREHCLARNGVALRQRKIIRSPGKLKALIKMFGLSKSDLASVGVPWPL